MNEEKTYKRGKNLQALAFSTGICAVLVLGIVSTTALNYSDTPAKTKESSTITAISEAKTPLAASPSDANGDAIADPEVDTINKAYAASTNELGTVDTQSAGQGQGQQALDSNYESRIVGYQPIYLPGQRCDLCGYETSGSVTAHQLSAHGKAVGYSQVNIKIGSTPIYEKVSK
jgi:hypothetical protein